uniref:Putative homing endonuclease n=1 Tax=viral metagenome TaxID=1070528 RepID=A0A6H1ZVK7_9ZZZZ
MNRIITRSKNEMNLSQRFWSKVDRKSPLECWNWDAHIGSDGYGQFWFKGKLIHAHRVAWMIRNDFYIPDGMIVLHTCDNKRCVNPYHLKLGTYSDNMKDTMDRSSYRMGRISRFYDGEVWLMQRLYNGGISQHKIAKIFKTSQGHISSLLSGKKGQNVLSHVEVQHDR